MKNFPIFDTLNDQHNLNMKFIVYNYLFAVQLKKIYNNYKNQFI